MENICPICNRHCPVDDLHCHRGREYFGNSDGGHRQHNDRPMRPEEKMIVLLRKCGHFLHHNIGRDGDVSPLINALSTEERATLETLLEKCLDSWQNLDA